MASLPPTMMMRRRKPDWLTTAPGLEDRVEAILPGDPDYSGGMDEETAGVNLAPTPVFVPRRAGIMPWEVGGPKDPRNIAASQFTSPEVEANRQAEAAAKQSGDRFFRPPHPMTFGGLLTGQEAVSTAPTSAETSAPPSTPSVVAPPFPGMGELRMIEAREMPASKLGPAKTGMPKPSAPIRALRLPSGKIIFSNVGVPAGAEGAEEIDRKQAAQEIRREQALRLSDASDSALSPIMRASVDRELRRMQGEDLPASEIEGSFATDETQRRVEDELALEEGERTLQLASLQNALRLSRMTPEQQAQLGNRDVQTAQFAITKLLPMLQEKQTQASEAVAAISNPQDPNFIADEGVRLRRIQEIQSDVDGLREILSLAMGQRP